MSRLAVAITSVLSIIVSLLGRDSAAQAWESAAQHPSDPAWEATSYPLVFVSYRINESQTSTSGQNCTGSGLVGSSTIGVDAVDISLPKRGNELWILLPNGQVKRLFPYLNHQAIVDSPIGTLGNINGTVLEPSIALDGRAVYFSYIHDTANNNNGVGYSKGADIYRIDLGPIIDDVQVDPSTLPIKRLTQSTSSNRLDGAMNFPLANSGGNNGFGNMYLGATEMNTYFGTRLVFVSDFKRLINSNMHQGSHNRNFNLYEANINPDYSLGEIKQFQYYTTTSVLSPTRLRNGIAFSYQSTTEMNRQWQIQSSDSAGKWAPLYGYGSRTTVIHNTTFCRKSTPSGVADFVLTGSYYNVNNNGFGAIIAQDMSRVGTNDYDSKTAQGVKLPFQVGSYNMTANVSDIHDDPAPKAGNGKYYGKFATPACAETDRVYMAYTPTSANDKECDVDGNRSIYRSMIVTKNNLNAFDPVNNPAKIVVRDQNFDQTSAPQRYGAVWPQPVVSHFVRTGDAYQQYSVPAFNPATGITPGDPFAMFGTSALYNTDVTTPDCKIQSPNGKAFSPNHTTAIQREAVVDNVANLTKLPSVGGYCAQPTEQEVFGIKIFLTSNEASLNGGGYETALTTAGGKSQEAKRLLGTYNITAQSDASFKALVPANAPMDFHLIDRATGLKFADVNSWHSLKPGELRADCGGCHNHKANAGIAWEGTYAESAPALNLTNATQYIDYGLGCQVQYKTMNESARNLPEWRQDIFPGFDRNCGGCHSVSGTNPAAVQARQAFQYGPENGKGAEEVLYDRLLKRNFVYPVMGALSSPAFWAAYGARTDGRNNTAYSGSASFQADYPNCSDSGGDADCGFQFWSGHSGVCNTSLADAQWVYSFGDWIDNHAPRDTGVSPAYKKDRYHPSVDSALSDPNCSITSDLHVGYWDDSGQLKKVEVLLNGSEIGGFDNEPNGSKLIALSSLALSSGDVLKVKATDPSDNTQSYEKSVQDIVLECMARNGYVPPPPTPTPPPGGSPDEPGATPTPGENQITLSVKSKSVKLGSSLVFNIQSNLTTGNFVIVGTISSKKGESSFGSPWNIALPEFSKDQVTSRTLKAFTGKLEASSSFQIKLPTGESGEWLLGKKFKFVALVQGPGGTIASNPVIVKFKKGSAPSSKSGKLSGGKPAKLGMTLATAAKKAKAAALKAKAGK